MPKKAQRACTLSLASNAMAFIDTLNWMLAALAIALSIAVIVLLVLGMGRRRR